PVSVAAAHFRAAAGDHVRSPRGDREISHATYSCSFSVSRIHANRTAGGDRHHRPPDRDPAAGPGGGPPDGPTSERWGPGAGGSSVDGRLGPEQPGRLSPAQPDRPGQ